MIHPLEDLYIPTNGITLHALAAGPADGPLAVLLHGFPEFWRGWECQIDALAQAGYRVIAPDQRGYNLSDKPRAVSAYAIEQLAGDVLGILAHFGRQQAVIAGHDWGAAVAWYLGMHHPERVARLVIANVPHLAAFNRALRQPVWRQLQKSLYIFYFQIPGLPEWSMLRGGAAQLARTMQASARPGTFSAQTLEEYRAAWLQPGALTGGLNWYRAMLRPGRRSANRRFDTRVRVPTLVLWGERDAFLEPFLADWSMEWVDNGQLARFPEAGHWVLREEAQAVNRTILTFLHSSG